MKKQAQVVVEIVRSVFPEGRVENTTSWSAAQKEQVFGMMFAAFKAGEWTKSSGGTDDVSVMKYIPGLVNNHVRKDLSLNGGVKYEAKNPGSRTGNADPEIKALRQLLSVTRDPEDRSKIQGFIDARLSVLNAAKAPAIDTEALPEALRHLVK